jgi:hypothetical protein
VINLKDNNMMHCRLFDDMTCYSCGEFLLLKDCVVRYELHYLWKQSLPLILSKSVLYVLVFVFIFVLYNFVEYIYGIQSWNA